MPAQRLVFEPTPNPNAMKCVLATPLDVPDGQTLPFRSAPTPEVNAVAAGLMAIEGVTGVLLSRTWVTVNKAPAAQWKSIKPAVERALAPEH